MSQTISFVATDKLAEWLEEEADRRMTTVSSTAQQLLVEKYRDEAHSEDDESGTSGQESSQLPDLDADLDEQFLRVFRDYPDAWYRPKNDAKFAVRVPEDAGIADHRRYYKTAKGAAKAIRRWYE